MSSFRLIPPNDGLPFALPGIDVSGITRKYFDVRYAAAFPAQTLDIYLPDTGEGPFPTIIFIHGGAFWGGEKRGFEMAVILDAIEHGYAVASVEYRLAPETLFPYPLFDIKAAIRFLRANAAEYGLDPSRFAAAGCSAGAYYALMAAATQGALQFEDLSYGCADASSGVSAAIGFFGVYDLVMQSEFIEELGIKAPDGTDANFADVFAGVKCPEHAELLYFTDPTNLVTPAIPPVLIQAGDADEVVPYRASVVLAEKINAVCGEGRAELDVFPGALHGDPAFSTPENFNRILEFLDKHLKGECYQ
jgi:acetyl esterase/lipase